MEQIIDRFYVGSDEDVPEAKKRGYSILACCKDGINGHRAMLGYESLGAPKGKNYFYARKGDWMALNLIDVDNPRFIPDVVIDAGLAFIDEQMEAGNKILIHCNAGMSRGPSVALMYLRKIGEMPYTFGRAMTIFKTLYPKYSPGFGMEHHVKARWN